MSRRPLIASEAAEPFDAMTRPPVSLAPTITVLQAPSPEPVERRPRPTSPVPPSPASAPPAKRRKTAGHKVGFESLWAIERPWVFCAEEHGVEVLMCKLCTTHKPVGVGQRCMYVYIYSPDMDIQKYTVTMKIIVNSVKISSPIGTISNSEVVDLQ